ncbi:MAG: ribosome maturation factor RimP [Nocardiopsaceae bacterium]|nr:ribosome maturation factor RimP [Nocardiopsaceae bacterium]
MPGGRRRAVSAVDEERLAGLVQPVAAANGMDVETVRVSLVGQRRLLRIVVDSDAGVSLDDAAEVSRKISAALDATDVMGEIPYTLEVSSPGVDRPLTRERHWRRAVGRLVRVKTSTEGTVTGRVLAADTGGVTLDVAGVEREHPYHELGPGAVQVEFGRIPDNARDDAHPDDMLPREEADLGAGGDGH